MKKFRYLFVCLLAVFTGLYFVSCGSDDDEVSGDPNSVVGTWLSTHEYSGSGYHEVYEEYIMFCEDGTCYQFEKEDGDVYVEKQNYEYNKETSKLSIIEYIGGRRYTYVYEVVSLSGSTMVIRDNNSGSRTSTARRVKSPYTASQLEKFYEENK